MSKIKPIPLDLLPAACRTVHSGNEACACEGCNNFARSVALVCDAVDGIHAFCRTIIEQTLPNETPNEALIAQHALELMLKAAGFVGRGGGLSRDTVAERMAFGAAEGEAARRAVHARGGVV